MYAVVLFQVTKTKVKVILVEAIITKTKEYIFYIKGKFGIQL